METQSQHLRSAQPSKSEWHNLFEVIGTFGSLLLLPWLAFFLGEYFAPIAEGLLSIVGIHLRLAAAIRSLHQAYSGWPGSYWMTLAGLACWAIFLAPALARLFQRRTD